MSGKTPVNNRPCWCPHCNWRGTEHALQPRIFDVKALEPGLEVPAGRCPECGRPALLDDRVSRQRRAGPSLYEAVSTIVLLAEAQQEHADHESGRPARLAWQRLHDTIMDKGTPCLRLVLEPRL